MEPEVALWPKRIALKSPMDISSLMIRHPPWTPASSPHTDNTVNGASAVDVARDVCCSCCGCERRGGRQARSGAGRRGAGGRDMDGKQHSKERWPDGGSHVAREKGESARSHANVSNLCPICSGSCPTSEESTRIAFGDRIPGHCQKAKKSASQIENLHSPEDHIP